ncbi:7050_t:CDS:2, partial [Racocetra fulgida]
LERLRYNLKSYAESVCKEILTYSIKIHVNVQYYRNCINEVLF